MICEKIGPQHLERKAILYAYGKTHVVAGYDGAALRTRSRRKARDEQLVAQRPVEALIVAILPR